MGKSGPRGRDEGDDAPAIAPDGSFDIVALGDVHCHYRLLAQILEFESARRPFAYALTVGDLSETNRHAERDPQPLERWSQRIVRCQGNHERWAELAALPGRFVPNGEIVTLERPELRVAALGGVHVPRQWELRLGRNALPTKAFTKEQVERTAARKDIDILLTHEAGDYIPNPYRQEGEGQRIITSVVDRVRPRLHLCGHHHRLRIAWRGPTIGFMLPILTSGWVRIHYANGRPESYDVVRVNDPERRVFTLEAAEVPFPAPGTARIGLFSEWDHKEVPA